MAQTQGERKADTRERLLVAAADLIAAHGIDGVSVNEVAEAAGRTSGAVYAHFHSKQGLLLAVLDRWKQSILTMMFAEVAVSESPTGQLAAVWDNVAGSADPASEHWALLEHELWLRAARDPEMADLLRTRNSDARRDNARELGRWAASVNARPVAEPEELATLVKALLRGLEMQRRIEPESVTRDLAVRGLAALIGIPLAEDASTDRRRSASSRAQPS
jgi:AcrR family transcriptional regulator